jgi:bisphosphoglycerate-independent phosphoglycerate mutase (AlkP superfamily)
LISNARPGALTANGKLGDVAPTLLPLLGLAVPAAMTGTNLLEAAPVR